MPRRLCLVTGATAGIGEAFARLYAARDHDVAITGRRGERLEQLAAQLRAGHGVEVITIPGDLAVTGEVDRIIAALAAQGRVADAVVNNAGYGVPGLYADSRWSDQQAFIQVLVTAVCEMSHKLLPGMLERGYGRIVNVASVAGLIPGQAGATLYCGAKAMVVRFSQSLRQETLDTGVHVTALCPGYTWSEFHDVTGSRHKLAGVPRWMWMDAGAVASQGLQAVEANRAVCVTGAPNRAMLALSRFIPDAWILSAMHRFGSRLRPV